MSLRNIVDKLGGDLWLGGWQANVPAPGHSCRDRSVSLRLNAEGRVIVNTFAGTDWREVLDDLRQRGLIDTHRRPTGGGISRLSGAPPAGDRRERLQAAQAIWIRGVAVGHHTLSARHLALRAIGRTWPRSSVVRHSSGAPLKAFDPACRQTSPALLTALCGPEGTFTAVEVTFLDSAGHRDRRIRLSRKTVGPVPPGSAVRLDEGQSEMVHAEGVFSALSASERFSLPAWALLSTRNMRRSRPPPNLKRLLIAADRGVDGERSAGLYAETVRACGVRVRVEYPPAPYLDWNDAAKEKLGWPGFGGDGRSDTCAPVAGMISPARGSE